MNRSYALSLGAVAMAVVTLRGIVRGEVVSEVVIESIVVLVVFALLGWMIGEIADHLVRTDVEARYRSRVASFLKELDDAAESKE